MISRTLSKLSQIIVQILDEKQPTYTVHLRLTGKLLMDFLFVLIELVFASCYS